MTISDSLAYIYARMCTVPYVESAEQKKPRPIDTGQHGQGLFFYHRSRSSASQPVPQNHHKPISSIFAIKIKRFVLRGYLQTF